MGQDSSPSAPRTAVHALLLQYERRAGEQKSRRHTLSGARLQAGSHTAVRKKYHGRRRIVGPRGRPSFHFPCPCRASPPTHPPARPPTWPGVSLPRASSMALSCLLIWLFFHCPPNSKTRRSRQSLCPLQRSNWARSWSACSEQGQKQQ